MILFSKLSPANRLLTVQLLLGIAMILTASYTSGCRAPIVLIPSDKTVSLLKAGQSFTASNDVYLVPPARLQEILHKLAEQP